MPARTEPLGPVDSALTFFREFLREPAMVGSIIPTAASVVNAALAPVDWAETKLFVEYGPGLGTFTQRILDRLRPDATLIAIDTNPRFVTHLQSAIADPRLSVVHGSAADVEEIIAQRGHASADYVLSGLPFSTLPKGIGDAIADATLAALRPGGTFLVYQYSRFVMRFLQPRFASVEDRLYWANIPPCRLFFAHKAKEVAVMSDPGANPRQS